VNSVPVLPRAPEAEFGHGLRSALRVARDAGTPTQRATEPLSPELVLVCPDLRQRAIAALPERDPDAFLPGCRERLPTADVSDLGDLAELPPQARGRPRLLMAAMAYLAVEAAEVAAVGALVMVEVAGLVALATQLS